MVRSYRAARIAVRAGLLFGMLLTCEAARAEAEIEVKKDIVYGTGAGEELKLDLAVPKGLEQAAPAVVVIHGGGWMQGKRQDMADLMKRAAARGYVAATLSYRLAPKHRFPAQVEDVKCAVRYLRANAGELKIVPERIGAIGISAGAHLSMMLGTLDSEDGMEGDGGHADQPSKVQAVVSFVGPVNLVRPSYTDIQEQILENFFGDKPLNKQADCRRASPLRYVSKGDAPMLLFFGTKDPLIEDDQAYQMSEALTEAGIPGRVELLVGAEHGWNGPELERTLDASFRFFDEHLKK
ncbi:MAG: alpha/beta hydrolase fold domain-containing protein [Pirellulales bacterium]